PTMGTLNWASGDSTDKTINVPILNDSNYETLETFTVELSNAVNSSLNTNSSLVTIVDDNDASVSIIGTQTSIYENAGSVNITVSRLGSSVGAISVDYASVANTALTASDFTATSGTLSWIDADTATKTIIVPLSDDTTQENLETFSVQLSNPIGTSIGDATATVYVYDDDSSIRVLNTIIGYREDAGNAIISVARDGKNVGAVSVDYTTVANTAIAGSDYTTTSGTLNWSDGDAATKTIIVPLSDDTTQENLETFSVQLSNPIGTSIGDATATVYVYDDDSSIRVVNTIIGYRENAGNAIISVARDGKNVGAVSVDYTTVANTAIAGSDYTTTSGTLNWSDGDATPKTITVPIINDITLESLENFTVQLSNPIGTSIGDAIATIYIYNDDSTVRLYNTVYGIAENGTSINIIVKRDAHRIGAISVDYTTVAGTALAASDYTTTSGTLNWSDGDSTDKIITVNITNDGTAESLEYFDVQLSNPIGTSITTATSRVYIYNDD
ncbi:MAG: hypothetical protein OEY38_22575, partial [Gammaproteobacteria bacterium]|nr:hypothetical protein [Gammaproteobacteria bacterium]